MPRQRSGVLTSVCDTESSNEVCGGQCGAWNSAGVVANPKPRNPIDEEPNTQDDVNSPVLSILIALVAVPTGLPRRSERRLSRHV